MQSAEAAASASARCMHVTGCVCERLQTLTLPVRMVMQPSWVRVTELGSGRSGMALSSVSAKDASVRCRASYNLRCLS